MEDGLGFDTLVKLELKAMRMAEETSAHLNAAFYNDG